jgi:hypothetical protein
MALKVQHLTCFSMTAGETKMSKIHPIEFNYIPGHLFTWAENTGITEDSTIEANGYGDLTASNVIHVKSHRTGNFMTFIFQKEEMDRDGETVAWHYKSHEGVGLTILND